MRKIFLTSMLLAPALSFCVREPNLKQKLQDAQLLIKEGKKYLEHHDLYDACHVFSTNPYWQKGDLAISLIRDDGTIFTNPFNRFSLWHNIKDYDTEGIIKEYVKDYDIEAVVPSIKRLESIAGQHNELFIYHWFYGFKYSPVEKVTKNNKTFYLTAGFYPLSREFETKYLVKSFIHLIQDIGLTKALKNTNAPHFERGILFIGVYREDGTVMAHGEHKEWIGKNMINLKDKNGVPVIKNTIEIAKTRGKGWIDYTWHNVPKRGYVHSYLDPETNTLYAVMAAYYSGISKNMLPKFIKQAATYLTVNGERAAIRAFNNPMGEFNHGPLQIMLFNQRGKELTNTYKNNTLSPEFLQELIQEADEKGSAWRFGRDRFDEVGAYSEKFTIGGKPYYLITMYYLNSKRQATELLVNEAVDYLQDHVFQEAMREFSNHAGKFARAAQFIFVYDMTGRCLAHGDYHELLQRDLSAVLDQQGKPILEELIEIARKQQRGWASFSLRNSVRHIYVERVDKKIDKKTTSFIVGSGFWE